VDRAASTPAPTGWIDLPAAAVVEGDVTKPADTSPPSWLVALDAEHPWLAVSSPAGERWLDLYAEAVAASVVDPALVRCAVKRGHAGPHLLRLPPPSGGNGGAEDDARRLQRELATMKLSATFRTGRAVLAPVRAILRRLRS